MRFTVPLALGSPDHLHIHVLDTPDGALVVDTGAKGSDAALHAGLAAADVHQPAVLVTHGHLDHWGIATDLAPAVHAHPEIERTFAIAGGAPFGPAAPGFLDSAAVTEAFAGFTGLVGDVPEVIPVRDGQTFGDWAVLHTPGHDPAHICLYRAADGVLICGDLLLPGYTPNVQPSLDGSDALADFLASLRRVADLPVTLVLPAHGDSYADARSRASELLDHHARRLEHLREALAGGPTPLAELSAATFGKRADSRADRMLALMETYAHLEHLRRHDEATEMPDGRWSAPASPASSEGG
ncbi:MBL fold metallo-hydrolase [Paraconexibacter algicola]|uniref:MBL fold metallo-hydrolase n=1 Tax=Paraconexibacter algicola TaxID=2133960 RepID=UPI001304E379|nr:MBL fold metallo-hydrolase [Paraconexibacter algicola]